MAKAQTQAATGAAKDVIGQAKSDIPPVISGLQGAQSVATGRQAETYQGALDAFNQQLTTGGYDPANLTYLRNMFGGYQPSGAMDPSQYSALTKGYGDLATTGGYTPEMQQAFLNRATSGVAGTAANLTGAAQRAAAAGGGSAEAAIADIQGQLGAQQADATTNAMLGLNQQITANRLAGLGGMAGVQGQLQQGRLGLGGLQTGLEAGVAGGAQRAAQGIQGLYNETTGQITSLGQQILQGLGLKYSTQEEGANILAQLSRNPGLFQTAIGDIAQLGGAAGGVMGGMGAMGAKL